MSYCHGILCPSGNDDPRAGCGNDGSDGDPTTGAQLFASGTAGWAADDLTLTVRGLRANQLGLIDAGMTTAAVHFGAGRRSIDPVFYRYPVQMADSGGRFRLGPQEVVSLSTVLFAPTSGIQVGETWNFQV